MTTRNSKRVCNWICDGILVEYKKVSQQAMNEDHLAQHLFDTCTKSIEFAKFVNDPVDKECPDLCDRLIPTILQNHELKRDLLTPTLNAGARFEFCGDFDYSGDGAKRNE
ncbi:hypothetical protein ANCCAN_00680 [Ancylostoma caninum]|uniref:Saposin B-type domain-containing protein n=1 Tax=Ancylostoma caninum TaxID=29170 RepID=A0A368HCT2_ANCCA|nr:hypothetical protein ANCCAN_00680 [Ancylostoma caninum]